MSPILVLGQNGTAFAANGALIDPNNPESGTTIASFNPVSGAVNWTYTGTPQTTLTMMAVLSDGTLAINDSQYGIYQLGANGAATKVTGTIGGIAQYSWGGNWYVQNSQAASELMLPLDVDPAGIWATPYFPPITVFAEPILS